MMKNKITDLKEDIMTTIAKIKEIVLRFMKKMKKDRVSAAAAESAFFVIMGFVPFFMLLLTLVQYTELSPEMVMSILMEMLPASFYDPVHSTDVRNCDCCGLGHQQKRAGYYQRIKFCEKRGRESELLLYENAIWYLYCISGHCHLYVYRYAAVW